MSEEVSKNFEAYNKGFAAGKLHNKPSPETMSFMEKIEVQITEIKEDLKDIPRKADMELFVTKAINNAIDKTIVVCDKKYAPRYVATILNIIAVTFLTAVIGCVVKFAFDHVEVIAKIL